MYIPWFHYLLSIFVTVLPTTRQWVWIVEISVPKIIFPEISFLGEASVRYAISTGPCGLGITGMCWRGILANTGQYFV